MSLVRAVASDKSPKAVQSAWLGGDVGNCHITAIAGLIGPQTVNATVVWEEILDAARLSWPRHLNSVAARLQHGKCNNVLQLYPDSQLLRRFFLNIRTFFSIRIHTFFSIRSREGLPSP